ncbi:hypothetical protein DL766_003022 [Monosporascus sp. MC13-8B]|uniref:Heterokaryon incompatibility domain-containing protein n=1 Tax=Monosporascus cannonballus TaxID=155416 RepID=A0ABY0H705_9PEZI|nr:hypothetical protein DL762_004725 [Monosporascus cannonballus]RYO98776.1 hypothetical protein DL763_002037 [Monosporascus cannonballus]RYP34373.1 hypothetical protein DL766_003022 [Monosporascus sp. MC13-8B]
MSFTLSNWSLDTSCDEFGSFKREDLPPKSGLYGSERAPFQSPSGLPPDLRPLPDENRLWDGVDTYENYRFRYKRWEDSMTEEERKTLPPLAQGPVWLGPHRGHQPSGPPSLPPKNEWKSVKDSHFVHDIFQKVDETMREYERHDSSDYAGATNTSTWKHNTPRFPVLPDEKGPVRFVLLRHWLRACDETHRCFPISGQLPLPARVLEVLDNRGADMLRLRCTKPGDMGRYVALSHRWSNLDNFCTYRCNIKPRLAGIDFESLPRRFQDAVIVTRKLGIPFLWIDSICIIQSHRQGSERCPDECSGSSDLSVEIGKMEEYFGSAYCTIAATSVTHQRADEGFLERRYGTEWARVPDNSGSLPPGLSAVDDFRWGAQDANLNSRGWVLQERALSRRTIHFISTQAYWECGGDDIRCETLSRLYNPAARLLSDFEFPRHVIGYDHENAISLFQALFTQYSKCDLAFATDRSVALSCLESRFGEVFETEWRYGPNFKVVAAP